MEKEKLVITKDNYKGYVELYKAKTMLNIDDSDYIDKLIKKMLIIFGLCCIPIFLTMPLELTGLLTKGVVNCELMLLALCPMAMAAKIYYTFNSLTKKNVSDVKDKYSYVDTKIDVIKLKESLEEVKILVNDGNIECLKVDEYENYLKIEELKKDYLQETKYDGYVIDLEIEKIELDKPKVKKLVR